MRKLMIVIIALGGLVGAPLVGRTAPPTAAAQADIPYYFIAIHNEPTHGGPNGTARIELAFETLVSAEELLPEEHLDETFRPGHPCGDRVCDAQEQVDDSLCPADCADAPEVVTFTEGQPFRLEVGQTGLLPAHGLSILFRAITEDSRCPANVLCVWAGQVTALQELAQNGAAPEPLSATGFPDPDHPVIVTWTPFWLEVLEVGPYPGADSDATPDETYVILRAGPLTE